MKNILSIGSIVEIKEVKKKVMIISRGALFNKRGVIGYLDYSGCLYPDGQNTNNVIFFNEEDIEKVCFSGYCDEEEEEFKKQYALVISKIKYPRIQLEEEKKSERF